MFGSQGGQQAALLIQGPLANTKMEAQALSDHCCLCA